MRYSIDRQTSLEYLGSNRSQGRSAVSALTMLLLAAAEHLDAALRVVLIAAAVPAVWSFRYYRRPILFASCVAAMLLAGASVAVGRGRVLDSTRTFFGQCQVSTDISGRYQVLLGLYLNRLSPDGAIAFHISNRHLSLGPVLGGLAGSHGLVALEQMQPTSHAEEEAGKSASDWVIMARTRSDLGSLASDPRWQQPSPSDDTPYWTDDLSNIFSVMHFR